MRVAWFSPLPPVHSGIAAYSVDVLAGLRERHQLDLYVDDPVWHAAGGRLHAGAGPGIAPQAGPFDLPLYRAFDFPVQQDRAPYDLIVYQLGNAACHRFMWPYLLRWPGLVVLHDAALHHARAQALLADRRADDYRAEFRFNHPGIDPRVADFVVAGLQGSPYYLWPMLRLVLERARAVVVHSDPVRQALAEEFPEAPLTTVSMGVPDPWENADRRTPNAEVPGTGYRVPGTGEIADRQTPDADGTRDLPGRSPTVEQARRLQQGNAERRTPNADAPGTGYRVPGTGDIADRQTPDADGTRDLPGRSLTVEQARRLQQGNAERRTPNAEAPGTGFRAPGTGENVERGTLNAEGPGTGNRAPGAGRTSYAEEQAATPHFRLPPPDVEAKAEGRLPKADLVLAAFGVITPEKRILPILRALAVIRDEAPHVRLRLVGEIGEHYALWQDVARTGTRDLIEVTGYVDDEQLAAELRGADVCLCLRWPTARETSASWLRCLAAGKPTVVPDQLSIVDVPTIDPRHWQLKHDRSDAASVFQPPDASRAVAVSVELADEEAMIRQALRRLVADSDLRRSLGERARAWWEAHHTLARMQRDYTRVMEWAAGLPLPEWPADAPPHLHPDPAERARRMAAPFGVEVDILR